MIYARGLFNNMLDFLASVDDAEVREFVDLCRQYERDEVFQAPFVASFCEAYDELDLWRQYADDGRGFSLGFRLEELRTILDRQASKSTDIPDRMYVFKVLYKPDDQEALINKLLQFALDEFKAIRGADEPANRLKSQVFAPLSAMLGFFVAFLKHPCYENEKECRLVLEGSRITAQRMRFAARSGYFKPYIDLKVEDDRTEAFPLDTVVVGPASDRGKALASVQLFLEAAKMDQQKPAVQVAASTLPYAGRT